MVICSAGFVWLYGCPTQRARDYSVWTSHPQSGSVQSVKNFAKPRFFAMSLLPITAMVGRMVFVFARVSIGWVVGLHSGHRTYAS